MRAAVAAHSIVIGCVDGLAGAQVVERQLSSRSTRPPTVSRYVVLVDDRDVVMDEQVVQARRGVISCRSASSGIPWLRAASCSSSSVIPSLTCAGELPVGGLFDHAEQLTDAADQQPLLVDLDPDAGGRREHHVVADLHGHRDSGRLPPVDARPDRQHDPVLRRRLVLAGGHDQTRPAYAVGVELLYDNPVEERFQLVTHLP